MSGASVARRVAWSVFGLSPGLVALALAAAGWAALGAAVAAPLVLAALAPALQGRDWRAWRRDPGALFAGLLAWGWVSCVDPSLQVASVFAALIAVAVHQAFGGTGQSPFHPAAAAVALVLLIAPATGAWTGGTATSLAFAAGGLVMLARRLSPISSVAGWFVGLGIGCLLAGGSATVLDGLAPAHLLVGGFVFADGGSSGVRGASRGVCGLIAGLLAATLPGNAALPCAILLANLCVPMVERAVPPRARA